MAEAILWGNIAKREHERVANGRLIKERVPQTATFGDYDSPKAAMRRWRSVVDANGNDVRVVITTAAADIDVDGPYARRMRLKWRYHGWFEKAACPVALYLNGDLYENHLVDANTLADAHERRACAPGAHSDGNPCPHVVAEMAARRAKSAAYDAERQKNFKSETEKLLEGQARNNEDLLKGLLGTVTKAVSDAASSTAAAMTQTKDKK